MLQIHKHKNPKTPHILKTSVEGKYYIWKLNSAPAGGAHRSSLCGQVQFLLSSYSVDLLWCQVNLWWICVLKINYFVKQHIYETGLCQLQLQPFIMVNISRLFLSWSRTFEDGALWDCLTAGDWLQWTLQSLLHFTAPAQWKSKWRLSLVTWT